MTDQETGKVLFPHLLELQAILCKYILVHFVFQVLIHELQYFSSLQEGPLKIHLHIPHLILSYY